MEWGYYQVVKLNKRSSYNLVKIWLLVFTVIVFSEMSFAKVSKGVWWWRGGDVADVGLAEKRLEFLVSRGVGEIYLCVDLKKYGNETRSFVKRASEKGVRVAYLSGDVSWIYPGSRGFAETLNAYLSYQKKSSASERFYAIHLDVEPHQDRKLSNDRKWQLYADFVLRAAADVHATGEKIEWDIPFWLDNIRVEFNERKDVPLLDVVMGCSDCVALMSYRDTAKAILDISKTELDIASKGGVRIVLGAETGETGEGSLVTFFEEGASVMDVELAKVVSTLQKANIPLGAGIAIHHLGSWEKLIKKENNK